MPDHLHFPLRTLRDPGPPVEIRCSCDDFWSVAQQHAMLQLYARIVVRRPGEVDLRRESHRIIPPDPLPDPSWPEPCAKDVHGRIFPLEALIRADYLQRVVRFSSRALRIAGAYARIFLEDFEHGDTRKLGRFYWAGLAAFASKQVAFTLRQHLVQTFAPFTLNALGRGNLWLYNDALPWHYAWALCPESVRLCAARRQAPDLHPVVLANLRKQEWSEEALANIPWNFDDQTGQLGQPIGQLRWAPLMGKALDAWEALDAQSLSDAQTLPKKRAALALEHLQAMARHEQGEVLQGFVYEDLPVRASLYTARTLERHLALSERYLVFKIQLSFSAKGYVEDPAWRSDAPPGIRVENYKERMKWIGNAAKRYHSLMNGACRDRLLAELRILADHDD